MAGIKHTYIPKRVIDSNGIADGASIAFYLTGTLTPADIYTTPAMNIELANPVVVAAGAEVPDIYLDPAVSYRRIVTYSDGSTDDDDPWTGLDINGVGYTDTASSAVPTNVATVLANGPFVSAFNWLTGAQQNDVSSYTGALDVTTPLQAALDEAWESNRDLFIPAGLYSVTQLVVPGTPDGRTKAFRVYGQGTGELFARGYTGGTIIKQSGTTGSLITNDQELALAGDGNIEVAYIRFEGNSADPVVDFETLYAQSEFHHCGVFQAGAGDGIRIRHANTIEVHHNYILNSHWASESGVTRTGIGLHVTQTNDNGLQTFRKNTVRGFDTAYKFGASGSGGYFYSMLMEACEASVVTNGIYLTDRVRSAVIAANYIEGGDGGYGLKNEGDYNLITGNFMFPGFLTLIDNSANTVGVVIENNTLSIGAVENAVCAKITNRTKFSGNALARTQGTAGQKGIQITGSGINADWSGNFYDPASAWTGTGAKRIDNQVNGGGAIGLSDRTNGNNVFPHLGRGSASFILQTLGDSAVSGTTLTIPEGSLFDVTLTGATAINTLDGGEEDGRLVILRDTNGNFDLADSAFVTLAGGAAFSGPGNITMILYRIGANTYADEVSRAVY